ncbi:MAG: LCP family protein [Clostridia bacterium]|nr:LCP family protein [Clostridia bacterium]
MKAKKFKAFVSMIVTAALLFGMSVLLTNCASDKTNTGADTSSSSAVTENSQNTTALTDTVSPDEIEWNGDSFKAKENGGLFNILLIGQDKRPGEGRQRADTMILCSFNPETNELAVISFLRDLYVQIPGYSDNRLNAAYAYGGFPLIRQTFEQNFGITADGCLEVDFDSFEKIIDILGGVDIELTAAEAKIVGGDAHEGVCLLDGEHALTYARIRKIDSDFQRTERQRKVLSSVFTKMKDSSMTELMSLVSEILPLITTDMADEDLLSFAASLAASLSELKVENYGIPSQGNYRNETINGMMVLVPDLYEIKKLLFEEYLPI